MNKRGGRRESAGKKPYYNGTMESICITLLESHIDWLKDYGKGSVSRAVRWLIAEHKTGSHEGVR